MFEEPEDRYRRWVETVNICYAKGWMHYIRPGDISRWLWIGPLNKRVHDLGGADLAQLDEIDKQGWLLSE